MQMHMVTQKQHRTVVNSQQKGIRAHMQTHMPTHKVRRMTCHVGWPEKFSHVEREREREAVKLGATLPWVIYAF